MTHGERLEKIEAWIKAADRRNLVKRVEKLEAEQNDIVAMLKRLIGGIFRSR